MRFLLFELRRRRSVGAVQAEQRQRPVAQSANEDQIVSSDVIGMRYGSLFDATQTMVAKIDDDTYQMCIRDRVK